MEWNTNNVRLLLFCMHYPENMLCFDFAFQFYIPIFLWHLGYTVVV